MLRRLATSALVVGAAVLAATVATAGRAVGPPPQVTICHQPGTPAEKTLSLPKPAADAQIAGHVATLGGCGVRVPCSQPATPAVPAPTDQPVDEDEWVSEAQATLVGVSESALNPAGAQVRWTLSCPTLVPDASSVAVYLNGQPVASAALALTTDFVTVTSGLTAGRNELELIGTDKYGFTLDATATLWAGSYAVPVLVLDETGQPVGGATVVAHLGDDPAVQETVITIR